MALLYHKDMMRLLALHKNAKRFEQIEKVSKLLEDNRKGSNQNYQAVVNGHRPSKFDQARQRAVQQLSRDNAKAYWLKAIAEAG
jgi:hypothetical protein